MSETGRELGKPFNVVVNEKCNSQFVNLLSLGSAMMRTLCSGRDVIELLKAHSPI